MTPGDTKEKMQHRDGLGIEKWILRLSMNMKHEQP